MQTPFYQSYEDTNPAVHWTNPNPFGGAEPEPSPLHQFANTPLAHDSSASSSSAPSPPADLEISPLDHRPIPLIADYAAHDGGAESLPFDLDVFNKTPGSGYMVDMNGRPRGLSILGPTHVYNEASYTLALQAEDLVGEISNQEEINYEHYLTSVPVA
jgi:hypothetical protein